MQLCVLLWRQCPLFAFVGPEQRRMQCVWLCVGSGHYPDVI